MEIAGCVVPEDPEQKTLIAELEEEDVGEEFGGEEEDDELDPEMVKEGRREEVEFMKEKLEMFEFGTWEEAMAATGGKPPTTTKWVEG